MVEDLKLINFDLSIIIFCWYIGKIFILLGFYWCVIVVKLNMVSLCFEV